MRVEPWTDEQVEMMIAVGRQIVERWPNIGPRDHHGHHDLCPLYKLDPCGFPFARVLRGIYNDPTLPDVWTPFLTVSQRQRAMVALGEGPLEEDGRRWGQSSAAALRRLQGRLGMVVNGIVDQLRVLEGVRSADRRRPRTPGDHRMNPRKPLSLSKTLSLLLLTALPLAVLTTPAAAAKTILHVGGLIDGKSDTVAQKKSIVVEDGKIVAIEDGYTRGGEGDTVIDLKGSTVMPGLMDMHTHLSSQGSKNSYAEGTRLNTADYAFRSVVYAERTLMAGFTTVRDLGDRGNLTISLRNAINAGLIPRPAHFHRRHLPGVHRRPR